MRLIESGKQSATLNMQKDAELLQKLGEEMILHLYDWEGISATYGHFIKPEEFFKSGAPIHLAKRPTGGGVIFHHCDLTFSLLVPTCSPYYSTNTLENYAFVNQKVIQAIEVFLGKSVNITLLSDSPAKKGRTDNFCMAHPTKYDVIWKGKKVGGAAQRRTKRGFLHQGTISLGLPEAEFLESLLIEGKQVADEIAQHSRALLGEGWTPSVLEEAKCQFREILRTQFRKL